MPRLSELYCGINKENEAPNHANLMIFEPAQAREPSVTGFSKDFAPQNYSNTKGKCKKCVTNGGCVATVDHESISFDDAAAQIHNSLGLNILAISQ